ncbi:DNA-directed RNA polymerase subunit omega [uncultured Clostridium sp.]|uniref:DNA-directed RNA polymerase subunit omega n=1 Tax=uncultured Clostridium sp. TaxID=59620 RepID=UPI0026359421|nr:DNA-directed RNA polymerase subunit omega [uncultured Clostridium sp.]
MKNSMISPSVVELLEKVDNRYSLVIISSKRARQIIDGAEQLQKVESNKPLSIAIREVEQQSVTAENMEYEDEMIGKLRKYD